VSTEVKPCCTCSPEHIDAGGFDPWCEVHSPWRETQADAEIDA
jgi:hypothetical protein